MDFRFQPVYGLGLNRVEGLCKKIKYKWLPVRALTPVELEQTIAKRWSWLTLQTDFLLRTYPLTHAARHTITIQHSHQAGFTMIEVLVTVIVIALGLLGNAALMLDAVKLNQAGLFRTQAVTLVQEIAERMEANPTGALAGNYATAASSVPFIPVYDCAANVCTATNLAAHDLGVWQNQVVTAMPGAIWAITLTSPAGANPAVYTIQLSWIDRRTAATYGSSGTSETFSYTTTKTVYQ